MSKKLLNEDEENKISGGVDTNIYAEILKMKEQKHDKFLPGIGKGSLRDDRICVICKQDFSNRNTAMLRWGDGRVCVPCYVNRLGGDPRSIMF